MTFKKFEKLLIKNLSKTVNIPIRKLKKKSPYLIEMEKSLRDLEQYIMIEKKTEIMKFIVDMFLYPDFENLTEYNGFLTGV